MFERRELAERLTTHVEIYSIAAAMYSDEDVAADFERLVHACRHIALMLLRRHPNSVLN